jgi:hypothetical protein
MAPPDTRRGPGGGPGPQSNIELAGVDEDKGTAHNPAACATCRDGVIPWTERRREEAASYAARSGRRIGDLQATG